MKKSAKILCAVLALVLALGCGIGGTLAFLAAKTNDVVNTFTFGNLSVTLKETTGTEYQIVPGTNITKDPKASVVQVEGTDKIDAYLFVEVTEVNWPAATMGEGVRKVNYAWGDGWTELESAAHDNVKVIYRTVSANQYGTQYTILKGNQVTVDGSLTKAEVDAAQKVGQPTLTFKAYAVQKDNLATPELAWAEVGTAVEVQAIQPDVVK